jgi:hypothetical protein
LEHREHSTQRCMAPERRTKPHKVFHSAKVTKKTSPGE